MKYLFFCLLFSFACLCPRSGVSQKGIFLAPQPHKLLYADTVYREAVAKKDPLLMAEAYYLYGKTYEATGDILLSNKWFYKSLKILEPRGDSKELSRLYLRLFTNAYTQGDYAECMRLIRLGMDMAMRLKDYKNLCRAYGNMKSMHERDWSDKGKKPNLPGPRPDSGLYYLQKVVQIGHRTGDSAIIAGISRDLANYKWKSFRDTSHLFENFNVATDYYTLKKEDGELMITKIDLAQILLDLNRPAAALAHLNEAQKIYDRNPFNVLWLLDRFQSAYSRYYRLTGNWKKAYEMNERAHQLKVSNYTADRDGAISRLGKEYEMEKKDILLKAKDTELALRNGAFLAQQRFLVVSFVLLIVMAGMSLVFYRLYKRNLLISRQNELLVKEQNHRVKNNLQAVSSLLSLQSSELSDPAALRAIEESRLRVETIGILHRKLYDGQQLAMVFVPDFLEELVTGVINTYGLREVSTDFLIDDIYLSPDQAAHLGLIVNELVTNACKYAFPGTPDPTLRLQCNTYKKNNKPHFHLEIADNGPGIQGSCAEMQPVASKKTVSEVTAAFRQALTMPPPGFGIKLIRMEAEQLYAQFTYYYDSGIVFIMDFPSDPVRNRL